ncbi:MAG: hypothetical protein SH850_03500 [Planctomycetaceae bacterium]|nr:hypothetical protein [Planctomycetaceae bacterium]
MVVVDHPQTTYSHAALAELMRQDAVVVICGRDHLPCGIVPPFADHNQVVSRIQLQVGVGLPLKKRLWQQLIRAKILAQAENLQPDTPPARRLREFAASVRSGDPDNREAHAARAYWAAWLMLAPEATPTGTVSMRC